MLHAAFLIPLFPFVGFLVLAAAGRKLGNPRAGWLATSMVLASFVTTLVVFAGLARAQRRRRPLVHPDLVHVDFGRTACT